MKSLAKNLLGYKFSLAVTSLLFLLATATLAKDLASSEAIYDDSYFSAISGEVSGQAIAGVKQITINGEPVQLDKNRNFSRTVLLADGQKYLTIEISASGVNLVKKYFILRHPAAQKRFTINLPATEFKKITEAKKAAPIKVSEIARGEAVIILEQDTQKIIEGEVQKYLKAQVPEERLLGILRQEAPRVLEKEVKQIMTRDVPTGEGLRLIKSEIQKIVEAEAPPVIRKEIQQSAEKKVSLEEARSAINSQVARLVQTRVRNIISDKNLKTTAEEIARQAALASVDKKTLQLIAQEVVKEESKKIIEKEALKIIRDEVQLMLKNRATAEAKVAQLAPTPATQKELQPQKIISTTTGKWAGYDLIWEIAPGKILLVKHDGDKYSGYLYHAKDRTWLALNQITHQELADFFKH